MSSLQENASVIQRTVNIEDFFPESVNCIVKDRKSMKISNQRFTEKILLYLLLIIVSFSFSMRTYDRIKYGCQKDFSLNHELMNVFIRKLNYFTYKTINLQKQCSELKIQLHATENNRKNILKTLESFRNEIKPLINKEIQETLYLYDADKIGKIDYALESAGGKIVSTPDTEPHTTNRFIEFLGFQLNTFSNPFALIRPGIFPGQCFAFKGQKGRIQIQLISSITVTSVTMDYPQVCTLIDSTSAPKDFKVQGINLQPTFSTFQLGEFTFVPSNKTTAIFPIKPLTNRTFELIELEIMNNYGNPNYTCIYRFRVHGTKN